MTNEQLRQRDAEYQALCGAIEREATESGFADFLDDPASLRDRVRDLSNQGLCEYPDADQVRWILDKFVPEVVDIPQT